MPLAPHPAEALGGTGDAATFDIEIDGIVWYAGDAELRNRLGPAITVAAFGRLRLISRGARGLGVGRRGAHRLGDSGCCRLAILGSSDRRCLVGFDMDGLVETG